MSLVDDTSIKTEEVQKRYSMEDILTLMGGTQYFAEEQVLYIYHKLNNDNDEAQYYLNLCLDTAKKLEEKALMMKTHEEIKAIEEANNKVEVINDEEI